MFQVILKGGEGQNQNWAFIPALKQLILQPVSDHRDEQYLSLDNLVYFKGLMLCLFYAVLASYKSF